MIYQEEELLIDINNYESKSINKEEVCGLQDRAKERQALHY